MSDSSKNQTIIWNDKNVSLSDNEIIQNLIENLDIESADALTPKIIYDAFQELKKASDAWIKYYMISVALLLMVAVKGVQEFSLFGIKFDPNFFAPIALIYFSVCTLVYTNFEQKMRFYKIYFKDLINNRKEHNRTDALLRYPLAFEGGEYLSYSSRPAGYVIGWRHLILSIPFAIAALLGKMLATFGLGGLLFYNIYTMLQSDKIYWFISYSVIIFFACSMVMSGTILRNPNTKHKYTFEEIAKRNLS